jgi:hypothetical protein
MGTACGPTVVIAKTYLANDLNLCDIDMFPFTNYSTYFDALFTAVLAGVSDESHTGCPSPIYPPKDPTVLNSLIPKKVSCPITRTVSSLPCHINECSGIESLFASVKQMGCVLFIRPFNELPTN